MAVSTDATQALNEFANAVRECLGLAPLRRHDGDGDDPTHLDVIATERAEAVRFYREPYVWTDITMTGGTMGGGRPRRFS